MRSPSSLLRRIPFALAVLVVAIALVVPVGRLLVRSFEVEQLVTKPHPETGAVAVYELARSPRRIERRGKHWIKYALQPDVSKAPEWHQISAERVDRIETVYGLVHYERVFSQQRTYGLFENSLLISGIGGLLAVLFGGIAALLLMRLRLAGAKVLGALLVAPAILPPFFIALGGARLTQGLLLDVLGFTGQSLHIANAALVLGLVLQPFVILFAAPALARIPAGTYEAARQLQGPEAAWHVVVWPILFPAILGAFSLCMLMGISDFAIPDLLSFMLPAEGRPAHVFATEIRLQWEAADGSPAQAVATGGPYLLITLLLLGLVVWSFRRNPLLRTTGSLRRLARARVSGAAKVGAYAFCLVVIGLALISPLAGIASWGLGAGETVANLPPGARAVPRPPPRPSDAQPGALFDFATSLENTPGIGEQANRWARTAAAAALLALLVSIPLARGAVRGGRFAKGVFALALALPLAVPASSSRSARSSRGTSWAHPNSSEASSGPCSC